MSPEDIKRLREICAELRSFRDNTVDGNGKNLHDIKVTFDYVQKTLEEYNISGTNYGTSLSAKAAEAGTVLSQFWLSFRDLEESIEAFCTQQEANNNRGI